MLNKNNQSQHANPPIAVKPTEIVVLTCSEGSTSIDLGQLKTDELAGVIALIRAFKNSPGDSYAPAIRIVGEGDLDFDYQVEAHLGHRDICSECLAARGTNKTSCITCNLEF